MRSEYAVFFQATTGFQIVLDLKSTRFNHTPEMNSTNDFLNLDIWYYNFRCGENDEN